MQESRADGPCVIMQLAMRVRVLRQADKRADGPCVIMLLAMCVRVLRQAGRQAGQMGLV